MSAAKYCFGVDLGGTTVKIGFFDLSGEILDKWEIVTRKENNGAYILEDIADAIKDKISKEGLTKEDLKGIGIGVPGPVLGEKVVLGCVNLGWGMFDVSEELNKLTGLPVKAANDANVAALGEQWKGGGQGHKDIVMITLGTGVGGGIIQNGKIISGVNGAAGEIGHMMIVDPEDITGTCGCGHVGCLEQAASATGIVNVATKLLQTCEDASCLRNMEGFTAKDVLDGAKAGDGLCLKAADKMMTYLAKAAAYIACTVNPGTFVIGGGVSRAGEFLTEGIRKRYEKVAFPTCADTPFVLAALGNDAGMIGAARLICSDL